MINVHSSLWASEQKWSIWKIGMNEETAIYPIIERMELKQIFMRLL